LGRTEELDYEHLAEYLSDMAKRDRRELQSRLRMLITHLLSWCYQAELEMRTGSWKATIITQQHDLLDILQSGVLRNYALDTLEETYLKALRIATVETGLAEQQFPKRCR